MQWTRAPRHVKLPHEFPFLKLLKSVDEGITIYDPLDRNAQGMTEFQDLAARLIEMERLGFVHQLVTRKREIAGMKYYDMVMVTGGGLTAEGKQMLDRALDES